MPICVPITNRMPLTRFLSIVAACALGLCLTGCKQKINDTSIEQISVADVRTAIRQDGSSVVLLDSRTDEQRREGVLPDARAMRAGDIDLRRRDPWLEQFKLIVVYGQNPASSSATALTKRLLIADYDRVRLMIDGVDGWVAQGHQLTPEASDN